MTCNDFIEKTKDSDIIVVAKNNEIETFGSKKLIEYLKKQGGIIALLPELLCYGATTGNKTFDKLFKQDLYVEILNLVRRYKLKSKL